MSTTSVQNESHRKLSPSRSINNPQRTYTSLDSLKQDLFLDISPEITSNEKWGDELTSKAPNMLRVYFQNVNGLQPIPTWDKWKEMLSELFTNDIDIAGLVETNINWTPIRTRQANNLLRKQFGNGTMINSTSDEPSSGSYK